MRQLSIRVNLLLILMLVTLVGCGNEIDIRGSNWGDTIEDTIISEAENYNNTDYEIIFNLISSYGIDYENMTQEEVLDEVLSQEIHKDLGQIPLVINNNIDFTKIENELASIRYSFWSDVFPLSLWEWETDAAINVMAEQNVTLEEPILLYASISSNPEIKDLKLYSQDKEEYDEKLFEELKRMYGEPEEVRGRYRWETKDTIVLFVRSTGKVEYLAKYDAVKDVIEKNKE